MRNLLLIALALVVVNVIRAEEPKQPVMTKGSVARPRVINVTRAEEPKQAEAEKRQLAEKLDELEKLQAEIDRLRERTGQPPQQVLVRVRVIEIQTGKLRQAGLSHPLQTTAAGFQEVGFKVIDQESLPEALQAVDVIVKKDFAKILADASMQTVAGRHERMLSGSEFRVPILRPDGSLENQMKFAGLDLQLLSSVDADQRITLDCQFKLSKKDFTHMVKFRDAIVPGVKSRSVCTRLQMKSGETIVLAGQGSAEETELVSLITSEFVQSNGASDFAR